MINQDLNPAWNETFQLWAPAGLDSNPQTEEEGQAEGRSVIIQVYDQDPFDHDFLGEVKIPLAQLTLTLTLTLTPTLIGIGQDPPGATPRQGPCERLVPARTPGLTLTRTLTLTLTLTLTRTPGQDPAHSRVVLRPGGR